MEIMEKTVICRNCGAEIDSNNFDPAVLNDYDQLNQEKCPVCGKRGALDLEIEEDSCMTITRYGKGNDDYAVYFHADDYSVRGTLAEILNEIKTNVEG